MECKEVHIPGYENADPEWIEKTLDEVHDIAQMFAYANGCDLSALDKNNRYFVGMAFRLAERIAHNRLIDIMMEIRKARGGK